MSTYDDVHHEAMQDRRNDRPEPDRPDPAEYADLGPLSARQFRYEPPRPTFDYDPDSDPF